METNLKYTDEHPDPKPMSGAQELVLDYLQALSPGGRLLDMPAGHGYLAEKALNIGFSVECCDIDPHLFGLKDIECKRVNLNRDPLPYPDGSFDIVASVGGLHRLFNPRNAVSEAWRVLAPGGLFLVGLKNYSSLRRRLLFLLTGFHAKNIITQSYHQSVQDPEANFRFPLTALHLFHLLYQSGFSIRDIKTDGYSKEGIFLFPLALALKALSALKKRGLSRKMQIEFSDPLSVLLGRRYILVVGARR